MSEFRLTKRDQELLDDEMEKWKARLNLTVAPILFAASGTFVPLVEKSNLFGLILLVFAFALMVYVVRDFPNIVKSLREKKEKTDREQMLLKGMIWHHFGLRGTLQVTPYLLSWTFMVFVAFGVFSPWLQ